MFRILIIEDSSEKLRDITSTLEQIEQFNSCEIRNVIDYANGLSELRNKVFDLLILDISIPMKTSGNVDPEGGLKLLRELTSRQIYNQPTHIIGLTAHQDIFEKAQAEFETNLLSIINYSVTDIQWQEQLKTGVGQRIIAKSTSVSAIPEYDYDVAIITAVDIEFYAVKGLSSKWERVKVANDASPYFETIFLRDNKSFRVIIACAPQMGMNACAILSLKMIHNFRPKYLFMTGIAASVKGTDVHGYGDVMVIDESWDGGAGKLTENDNSEAVFLPIAKHLRLDPDFAEKMRSIKDDSKLLRSIKDGWKPNQVPNTELNIHIGSVVSVAGVIENEAIIDELKAKDRKLLGLEMEAYAMYYSANNCSNPKPIAMALKSISDFANKQKNDMYQSYASYCSAKVLYEFIMREL